MVLRFFRGDDDRERLDRIETRLQQMLADDDHSFDLAMSTLLDAVSPHDVGAELRATDHRVNEAEREIRRELVVHASVHGSIDTPAVLVYMSIVKDIERIGDYAKNLFDVAADGGQLHDVPDADEMQALRRRVADLISQTGTTFADRDADRAYELLSEGDELLDRFDDLVSALVGGDDQGPKAVSRALTHRYLKRIVAHLMNVLSAVVMPIDQLDYFDEDPEDRR
jgi:phosphate transport system protein